MVRAAEEAASTLASSIHPEQCIKVLCPIIQTADYPINLAAIKMQTKVVERIAKESLLQLLADIIPGLLQVGPLGSWCACLHGAWSQGQVLPSPGLGGFALLPTRGAGGKGRHPPVLQTPQHSCVSRTPRAASLVSNAPSPPLNVAARASRQPRAVAPRMNSVYCKYILVMFVVVHCFSKTLLHIRGPRPRAGWAAGVQNQIMVPALLSSRYFLRAL